MTSFSSKKEVTKEIKMIQDKIDILDKWFLHYEEAGRMWVNENDNALKWVFPKSMEVLNKSDSDI